MITVKFLGGAKKSFQTDQMQIKQTGISVEELLCVLVKLKPPDSYEFDVANILIAVNGVDSSAMQGRATIIQDTDVVSIIPVIHGGSGMSLWMHNKQIQIMGIRGDKAIGVEFLEDLRNEYSGIVLQAVSKNFVASQTHIEKILNISLEAEKNDALLSKKLETDILMRFALTGQIAEAIKNAGIKSGSSFILIAIGNGNVLNSLYCRLEPLSDSLLLKGSSSFLKRHFRITKKHLDVVRSDTPLEDVLVEKAAILP